MGCPSGHPITITIPNQHFPVNGSFVFMHKFRRLHKSFLFILYNFPYCNRIKSVLFYKHKKTSQLRLYSTSKKHIGGKQKLPKNRPLQEKASNDGKGNIPDAKLYERSVKTKDRKKITHRNGFQKRTVKSNEREVANDD